MIRKLWRLYTLLSMLVVALALVAVGVTFLVNQKTDKTATVTAIIDGDTFVIDSGESVRLIGIDSPERGDPYYFEARDKLSSLVKNETVLLVRDKENKDQYGRLLRYVWRSNIFINAEMVSSGYATVYPYPPNLKYSDMFDDCQSEAINSNIGIWYKPREPLKKMSLEDFLGND